MLAKVKRIFAQIKANCRRAPRNGARYVDEMKVDGMVLDYFTGCRDQFENMHGYDRRVAQFCEGGTFFTGMGMCRLLVLLLFRQDI